MAKPEKVAVIGSSNNGDKIITKYLSNLNVRNSSVIIVAHQNPDEIIQVLLSNGKKAYPLQKGQVIEPGCIYVAMREPNNVKSQYNILGTDKKVDFMLKDGNYVFSMRRANRDSIDDAMYSAANRFGEDAVGVVLDGLGDYGTDGLRRIKQNGGTTVVQFSDYPMPYHALDADPDYIIKPRKLRKTLERILIQ